MVTLRSMVMLGLTFGMGAWVAPGIAAEGTSAAVQWIERLEQLIPELEVDHRQHPLEVLILAKAETGQVASANKLLMDRVPAERRALMLGLIAASQATTGQMDQVSGTILQIDSEELRQNAWKEVLLALARDRKLEGARATLRHLSDPTLRNTAIAELSYAYARHGDIRSARDIAKEIASDDLRANTRERIDRREAGDIDPIEQLDPGFLRDRISMMNAFLETGAQRDAILAIAAAQKGDDVALTKQLRRAADLVNRTKGTLEPRLTPPYFFAR